MNNKILIVGMGYVGLTLSASLLKNTNLEIIGLDKSKKVISDLKKGLCHIFEPDMDEIIQKGLKSKKIKFCTNISRKNKFGVIIICVGTPINNRSKKVINESIVSSCLQIKPMMDEDCLLILRSTVQIGTTRKIVKKILNIKKNFNNLAYCPERTVEGNAIYEVNNLPQIIATEDNSSKKKAINFFKLFNKKIVHLNLFEKAELIKLIDNSYRDTFFSMSNQIGLICKKLGISSNEIIEKANYKFDRTNLSKTGPVAGPCLSKDPYILDKSSEDRTIFYAGRKINEKFIETGCIEIQNLIKSNFVNKKKINVLIFGAAFKCYPPTNDMRYSPVLNIVKNLNKKFKNCKIRIFDELITKKNISSIGAFKIDDIVNYKKADILIINSCYIKKDYKILKTFLKNANPNLVIYSFWFFKELFKLVQKNHLLRILAN